MASRTQGGQYALSDFFYLIREVYIVCWDVFAEL